MSKLSFRARALDASKPMPIYMAEELPDLPDYSAINRAVPQMPSGMEKEEECEHHLQRAICTGLIIPTPDVLDVEDVEVYDKLYPANYKQPRQYIHMQPFTMEQDIPDYDMDSEDERWLLSQAKKLDLAPLKFEEMMDRLEKSSGQTVVTLSEAKALLKEDDDLIIAVFDYWLNKRLKTQHPLILTVKTEHRAGVSANNPYLAFRRRTEKMQTRKNRKNDETSYEKMLKLRRDLSRAVTLLELVKKREKTKREFLHLTIEIFEKRYQARDFSGVLYNEVLALKSSRPAFTPIFHNHHHHHHHYSSSTSAAAVAAQSWTSKPGIRDELVPRKEKRQYKKRKHKSSSSHRALSALSGSGYDGLVSSDEEDVLPSQSPEPDETEDEGPFAFRRNKFCNYHMPTTNGLGNWPWCSRDEHGSADPRYRFTLVSVGRPPRRRCIGFARRRLGRGGRVIVDRHATSYDDLWRRFDFSILERAVDTKPNVIIAGDSSSSCSAAGAGSDSRTDWTSIQINCSSGSSSSNIINNSSNSGISGSNISSNCGGDNSGESNLLGFVRTTTVTDQKVPVVVKEEPLTDEETRRRDEEMRQILQEIQTEWLHFRPKTPPPDYEPPCHLLPADDRTFLPSLSTPLSIELHTVSSELPLIDDSPFVSSTFTLQDLEVPVFDTRQSLTVDLDLVDRVSFGGTDCRIVGEERNGSAVFPTSKVTNSSGALSSSTVNNHRHVVNGPVSSAVDGAGAVMQKGTKSQFNSHSTGSITPVIRAANSTLSVTSQNTLNSHSANVLDITTSIATEPGVVVDTSAAAAAAATSVASKQQQQQQSADNNQLRKNNSIVMEVT